jgi:putative ABC transport system substrate-binding protein
LPRSSRPVCRASGSHQAQRARLLSSGISHPRGVSRQLKLIELHARSDPDIDAAFATMADRHVEAFLIAPDSFLFSRNAQIAALALRHALPAMYQWREFALAGGLISYGPSQTEPYRQDGLYAGRILKGQKPADLPVVQSTKIEMVINMRTAKALGLTVPATLLVGANEVIE